MSADEPIPSVSPEQPGDSTQAAIIAPGYSDEAIADLTRLVEVYERTITHNPFIRKDILENGKPHPKQQEFLMLSDTKEVFYGGAAAGGKSLSLLMAALQFVHVPGYNALILRNTFPDLNKPGGLIPRSKEWLLNHKTEWGEAVWRERDKQWTFPSGATLTFGYLERYDDALKYRSSEFHFIGWDELTLFPKECYIFLFSRLRKTKNLDVPLRMRSASNPGGPGHLWVRERFLLPHTREPEAIFIPAKIEHNPSLDREDYEKSLSHLDPITRAQVMNGDWEVSEEGRFKMAWFQKPRYRFDGQCFHLLAGNMEVGQGIHYRRCAILVIADLANTAKTSSDHSVFLASAVTPWQQLLILDVERKKYQIQQIPSALLAFCERIAERYGKPPSWAGIEANGTQIAIAENCRTKQGMVPVKYLKPANQDKLARAQKAIILAEQGHIYLPLNPAKWLEEFLYELVQFTGIEKLDASDDQVDSLAYLALNMGQAFFESPSTAGRSDSNDDRQRPVRPANDDGMGRIWRREGRMRRLFGGGA